MVDTYFRFFQNFMLNKFGSPSVRRPLNAQIELTLRCNAKCGFCSIWKPEYQKSLTDREMTTKEVKKIIDDLSKLNLTVLSITGGEPTLRSDLGELIEYSASKGNMTAIATNGYYLEKLALEGKLSKLTYCMVSLDYPESTRHDTNRGIKVFDRALRGIRALRKIGVKVFISTVVTKDNIMHMEDMCKLALKNRAMIELLPCENIIREVADNRLEVENIESEFVPNLHKWAREIRRLSSIYPNLTTDEITARIIESGGFGQEDNRIIKISADIDRNAPLRCHVASAYIFIKYNGDIVYPCKLHPVLSKSALKYPLDKIFHSPEVRAIQKKLDGYPFCKGCRLGCAIVTSIPMYWTFLYEKYFKAFFRGNFF